MKGLMTIGVWGGSQRARIGLIWFDLVWFGFMAYQPL